EFGVATDRRPVAHRDDGLTAVGNLHRADQSWFADDLRLAQYQRGTCQPVADAITFRSNGPRLIEKFASFRLVQRIPLRSRPQQERRWRIVMTPFTPRNAAPGHVRRQLKSCLRGCADHLTLCQRMAQLSALINSRAAKQSLRLDAARHAQIEPDASVIVRELYHVAGLYVQGPPGRHIGFGLRAGNGDPPIPQSFES